jgi:heme-degrading monooxygenase HmoA
MFAVIFEVQPKQERWNDYLDLAGMLRPELENIDGFIDNERFTSLRDRDRVLSLSTWRDEKALIRWRTLPVHHDAQEQGRSNIFADYHLRVGEVVADTHVPRGHGLPQQRFDETETGAAKLITITEFRTPGDSGAGNDALAAYVGLPTVETSRIVSHEAFTGITDPAKSLLLVSWGHRNAGERWRPSTTGRIDIRHRSVRIIRDYGMHDRREAPQYYRAVTGDE